jgi:hypothetical protein
MGGMRAATAIVWLVVGSVLLVPDRTALADPQALVPKTREDAAAAASSIAAIPFEISFFQVTPSYTDLRSGGWAIDGLIRTQLAMKYVLVPGLRLWDLYSVIRIDFAVASVNTPSASATGIADLLFIDGVIKPFHWGAIGLGFAMVLPSATNVILGDGKLQLGPVAAVAITCFRRWRLALVAQNHFSVAGDAQRPDVDRLLLRPVISLVLPHAFYLSFDPVMTFDWQLGGRATIPINLAVGHAFSTKLIAFVEPQWIATGVGKNSVTISVSLAYLIW